MPDKSNDSKTLDVIADILNDPDSFNPEWAEEAVRLIAELTRATGRIVV